MHLLSFFQNRSSVFRASRAISFVVACSVVSGCAAIIGGGGAPSVLYDLTVSRDISSKGQGTRRQLLVPVPQAVAALDTDRMLVRTSNNSLAYYPQAQWADRLPKLVQVRMVEAFEATGNVRAVGVPGQGLFIDVQVVPEIRSFEVEVINGQAVGTITLSIKLMNDGNGRVFASKVFSASVTSQSDSADAGAQALNTAFDQVVGDIVVWTLKRL